MTDEAPGDRIWELPASGVVSNKFMPSSAGRKRRSMFDYGRVARISGGKTTGVPQVSILGPGKTRASTHNSTDLGPLR